MDINWYPGHMVKTKRLISDNLKVIDVIFEVIDARIPLSSKITDLDPILNNKPRILIFNKWDLCDTNISKQYMKYYQAKGYEVINTSLLNKTSIDQIIKTTEEVKAKVNALRVNRGMKPRPLRILVVGIPNVGKSTLINALVKTRAANVGNKPGITKGLSWIRLKGDLELLDTPGILWPKFATQELALRLAALTAIREEVLPLEKLATFILEQLSIYYPSALLNKYDLKTIDPFDATELFQEIGERRGALTKGGVVDEEQVYRLILNDLKSGAFGPITLDREELV